MASLNIGDSNQNLGNGALITCTPPATKVRYRSKRLNEARILALKASGKAAPVFCVVGILLAMATDAYPQITYLECKEELGHITTTRNTSFFGKKGLETIHEETPPKALTEAGLLTHKVTLDPARATGTWRGDSSPQYYPTHISFMETNSKESEILKVSRQRKTDSSTSFARISHWMSSTPFPNKVERFVKTEASGTCRVIPVPKGNLF